MEPCVAPKRYTAWTKRRRSLVDLPPAVAAEPDLIAGAVAAAARGEDRVAEVLLRRISWDTLHMYWDAANSVVSGRHDWNSHSASRDDRPKSRIKSSTRLFVAHRDSWTCQYCGLRLIGKGVLEALHKRYPLAFPKGATDVTQHPATLILRYTPDHVLAKASGGTDLDGNLVAACGACQYAKWNCSLEELNLFDPRADPRSSEWDGLFGRIGASVC